MVVELLKIYPSTVRTIDRSQRFGGRFGAEIMQSRGLFLDNQYTVIQLF